MQNSLYKLFEHKCVLEVCVHIHPIMIKIHPVFFLNPLSQIKLFWDSCQNDVVLYSCPPLKCLVVGCNNEYSSCHLLLTPEPLKTQRINVTFVLKWMHRSPIYITFVYGHPNHSWSSFIYRRSVYKGFYESFQIAFPNNMLVSQFRCCSLVCSIDIHT